MESTNKARFYLISAGIQQLIANVIDEDLVIDLGTEELDGKTVTYVKNINRQFVCIKNIFQEVMEQGQTKPQLQRMRGTVLTLNVSLINNIAVVPKDLEDRLSAAVSGLIV
jgi:hypothetical protein